MKTRSHTLNKIGTGAARLFVILSYVALSTLFVVKSSTDLAASPPGDSQSQTLTSQAIQPVLTDSADKVTQALAIETAKRAWDIANMINSQYVPGIPNVVLEVATLGLITIFFKWKRNRRRIKLWTGLHDDDFPPVK